MIDGRAHASPFYRFEGTKATVYGVCSLFPPAYTVIVGDPEAVNFLFSSEGGLTREVDWESKCAAVSC